MHDRKFMRSANKMNTNTIFAFKK